MFVDELREIIKEEEDRVFNELDKMFSPYMEDIKSLMMQEAVKRNYRLSTHYVAGRLNAPLKVCSALTHPSRDVETFFKKKLGVDLYTSYTPSHGDRTFFVW